MLEIRLECCALTPDEQSVVSAGFSRHSEEKGAPAFKKESLKWLAHEDEVLVGALTADLLWDWLYIDELWVREDLRGQGLGKKLMVAAEERAASLKLTGVWLWTQSWQAAEFYTALGYQEFTRFPDFPRGHSRIGFRKELAPELL